MGSQFEWVRFPGSFRDPSGSVFSDEKGNIFRTITDSYSEYYRCFIDSGLKNVLVNSDMLVNFEEYLLPQRQVFKTLKVERIPFISYPYEWSFEQLKDAALLTLKIQQEALEYNMMLKDASAYNVQFRCGRPVFIDVLSFETAGENPWYAYKQFCSHFLAPLALMAKRNLDFGLFSMQYLDGIPLSFAVGQLPWHTRLNLNLFLHLYAHEKMQHRHQNAKDNTNGIIQKVRSLKVSVKSKMILAKSLEQTIRSLVFPKSETEWGNYYKSTNYSSNAFQLKEKFISEIVTALTPKRVLDIGANNGLFSRLAAQKDNLVVAIDVDPIAVNNHYLFLKQNSITKNILPLRINFANPSSAIGWENRERESFLERCNFDLVMVLALLHHMVISNNVPLEMLAKNLSSLGQYLLIEFIPKEDLQLQRLLITKKDVFPDYTLQSFLKIFQKYFQLRRRLQIPDSRREVFLFQKK